MKNVMKLVGGTILAAAMLMGCQKETTDPIFDGPSQGNVSFKKGGNNPTEPITDTIYVGSISSVYSGYDGPTNPSGWYQGNPRYTGEEVIVSVKNKAGNNIGNVVVTGNWSGCFSKTSSGTTSASGGVFISSGTKQIPTACALTFQITSLSKSGCYYKPSLNVVSSVSKVYP